MINFRPLATLALLGASSVLAPTAWAHDGHHVPAPQAALQAGAMTDELVRAINALEHAPADSRAAAQQRLAQAIAQRQAALHALADADPALALLKALPAALRAKIPAALAASVEQDVIATGTLVGRVQDHFTKGTAKHEFLLEVPAAGGTQQYLVNAADKSASERRMHTLVGRQVSMRAMMISGHLVVGSGNGIELAALGRTGSTTAALAPTNPVVQGNQSTLVVMGNFSDTPLSCSQPGLTSALFGATGSVDSHFRESSRGAVTFSGEVIGPFNIPYTSTGACDYNAWAAALDAAATAAGKAPGNYKRVSYALPMNSSCGWVGLGNVGGALPTRTWVASCSTGVFVHELGHNLNFHHASTPAAEYGDLSDPMGPARMVEFGGTNKSMAGWQPTGTVVDGTATGSFTLTSASLTGSMASQVLRVPKADTAEYYYVALRTASGSDASLGAAYMNLVSVHRATGAMPTHTYLLAELAVGQNFTDTTNGITITPTTISGDGTTISLVTTAPACASAAPSISMTPVSQTGSPGSTLSYTMAVRNNDASSCPSATFALSQTLPGGFSGAFTPASLTLAPGAASTVAWSVASAGGTANATYTVAAATTNASSGKSGSSSASYVVYTDSIAPTVSITKPANGSILRRGSISVAASASDNTAVKRVEFYAGSTLIGTDNSAPWSATWSARRAPIGPAVITARAFDAAGNHSDATVTITLK